jgi:hypothetical protein
MYDVVDSVAGLVLIVAENVTKEVADRILYDRRRAGGGEMVVPAGTCGR